MIELNKLINRVFYKLRMYIFAHPFPPCAHSRYGDGVWRDLGFRRFIEEIVTATLRLQALMVAFYVANDLLM